LKEFTKVAVFLKDTGKYFDEVEAQTWNHQTVFATKILHQNSETQFFFSFSQATGSPVNVVLNRLKGFSTLFFGKIFSYIDIYSALKGLGAF
jgi:hypothetical protein